MTSPTLLPVTWLALAISLNRDATQPASCSGSLDRGTVRQSPDMLEETLCPSHSRYIPRACLSFRSAPVSFNNSVHHFLEFPVEVKLAPGRISPLSLELLNTGMSLMLCSMSSRMYTRGPLRKRFSPRTLIDGYQNLTANARQQGLQRNRSSDH